MDKEKLAEIIENHRKWLCDENDGKQASLRCVNLGGADLRGADLRGADLGGANLRGADLKSADLKRADLKSADLRGADLSYTNLSYTDLRGADLRDANLSYTDLRGADLRDANLSGAKNLISPIEFLSKLEETPEGYIAYKTFGENYTPPAEWEIVPGSVLTEVPNYDRGTPCGCGINVANYGYVKRECRGKIWECLIRWEWLPGVVVPYNTSGQFRCERIKLVEVVDGERIVGGAGNGGKNHRRVYRG